LSTAQPRKIFANLLIQAELTLSSGEVLVAQLPRERIDYHQLKAGDQLHITSRESRTFVPDFAI
jgi:sulfate transport system ATP-binding protein